MSTTEVLLLGTAHLANPGRDAFNVVVDDVLSEHRQRELAAVAEDLARFEPTKVLVEHDPDQAEAVGELFDEYVGGRRELGRSEVEQIGFRVASLRELGGVVGIDVGGDFWESRIDDLAAADEDVARRLQELYAYGEVKTAEEQRLLATATIAQILRAMNTPDAIHEMLRPYLAFIAAMKGPNDYPGADAVANWYRRNLHIFANLLHESGPGQRLLVVFGQGHIPVLRHFIEGSGEFVIREVADYLQTP